MSIKENEKDIEEILIMVDLLAGALDSMTDLIENTVGEEYEIKDEIKTLRSFFKDISDLI